MEPTSERRERLRGLKKKGTGEGKWPVGEPEDHALGRSRGGFGTKIHLVTDGNGLPLFAHVTAGQVHDSTQLEDTVSAVRLPKGLMPLRLAGDKGYSAQRIRLWLKERSIIPVIPYKDDERKRDPEGTADFDRETYRRRSVVEQCIGWLKECRAVATRYDKLAVNFLAMVKLSMMQRYFRKLQQRNIGKKQKVKNASDAVTLVV